MKKLIAILITMAISMIAMTTTSSAMVTGIDSTNYEKYVKSVNAAYGYNKGECEREYLSYEELFYSKDIDHWNVDAVYDESMIPAMKRTPEYVTYRYIEEKHKNWKCLITLKRQTKSHTVCKVTKGNHVYHAIVKTNKVTKFKKIK